MAETDEYDGGESSVREVSANGIRMKTTEVEAKLDQGNIEEAESSLREGLSLNFEVRLLPSLFSISIIFMLVSTKCRSNDFVFCKVREKFSYDLSKSILKHCLEPMSFGFLGVSFEFELAKQVHVVSGLQNK